jgi:hypothetical protein
LQRQVLFGIKNGWRVKFLKADPKKKNEGYKRENSQPASYPVRETHISPKQTKRTAGRVTPAQTVLVSCEELSYCIPHWESNKNSLMVAYGAGIDNGD